MFDAVMHSLFKDMCTICTYKSPCICTLSIHIYYSYCSPSCLHVPDNQALLLLNLYLLFAYCMHVCVNCNLRHAGELTLLLFYQVIVNSKSLAGLRECCRYGGGCKHTVHMRTRTETLS